MTKFNGLIKSLDFKKSLKHKITLQLWSWFEVRPTSSSSYHASSQTDGRKTTKSAMCGSKAASWLFLFTKKFPAGLPTGKPAANFFKNQNNQKSSALASLNPCTVEVAETNARKEGIGSFVGSDMCCQLFLFMNQSLQHTPCMCVLNPILSTFHH